MTPTTMAHQFSSRSVIKVGGSLFDWPELPWRLEQFLDERRAAGERLALIFGGGPAADWVRVLDVIHDLGEERSHRLALRSLDFTAWAAMTLIPIANWAQADSPDAIEAAWRSDWLPLLVPTAFLDQDERAHPNEALPHRWSVTTDSIAARLAFRLKANLWLLKSALPSSGTASRQAAARAGLVDPAFPTAAQGLANVIFFNLRENQAVVLPP